MRTKRKQKKEQHVGSKEGREVRGEWRRERNGRKWDDGRYVCLRRECRRSWYGPRRRVNEARSIHTHVHCPLAVTVAARG